jgi:hypothetical protein
MSKQCKACKERVKDWDGDDPICAFPCQAFNTHNWNCATVNLLRDLVYEGAPQIPRGVDYQYCDDMKYATVKVDEIEGLQGGPLALWVSWYKQRGGTDHMWLLYSKQLPRSPRESEILAIVNYYAAQRER